MPLLVALAAAGGCAVALGALARRARRVSQTARLVVLFPAAGGARDRDVSLALRVRQPRQRTAGRERYGPQASSQREDVQQRLQEAVDQIDALPSLAPFVRGSDVSTPTTDRAFVVWSRTDLATYRLTSAVELYGATAASSAASR